MNTMVEFLILVLVAAVVIFAVVSRPVQRKRPTRRPASIGGKMDREFVVSKWATIRGLAASGGGSNLKNAVSEADKLLDYCMRHSGFRGETMGERLKNDGRRFSDLNGIWEAHKVRNALAHEADFDLVPSQVNDALNKFERGLRDLGAL